MNMNPSSALKLLEFKTINGYSILFSNFLIISLLLQQCNSILIHQFCSSYKIEPKTKQCVKHTYMDIINIWFERKHNSFLSNNGRVCSELEYPIIEREKNQFYLVEDRKVLTYSAFYERRKEAGGPAIRIVGAGYQKAYNHMGDLYCQMWYPDKHLSISVPAEYHVIYPSTIHPDMWCSHFIICPLPNYIKSIPYSVTVTPRYCSTSHFHLLVLNRSKPKVTNSFAVCLSPVYQTYKNWTTLIEMIEIHKQLGASEITTYNNNVHESTNKVFESYVTDNTENVNVYPWKPPYHITKKVNVHIQRGALNDCLYRMAHKHKFVTIQDLDEVLVPRKGKTWPELFFQNKIYNPDVGIYMFQHYYFRRNESNIKPYFVTQNSFWRTKEVFPAGKIRCKSLYNAEKAISVDLHFHYKMIPGATEYMVNPKEGALHHYRHEPMENFRKNPDRYEFGEDRVMEKYKSVLHKAYKQRINKMTV